MRAIILAAGAGRRLVHLTQSIPKALVHVGGKALIDYVRAWVSDGTFADVVLVGGCGADLLREHVRGWDGVRWFVNEDWTKGNILTLLAARGALDGDGVLLLNVDHVFPRRLLRRFVEHAPGQDVPTAFVDFDRPLFDDDMKVLLDGERRVARISKQLTEFQAGYIGSTFVPGPFLARYRATAEAVCAETAGAANVEAVLQRLADEGVRPRIFDATGIRWLEVDTPHDHANAERILAHVPGYLD